MFSFLWRRGTRPGQKALCMLGKCCMLLPPPPAFLLFILRQSLSSLPRTGLEFVVFPASLGPMGHFHRVLVSAERFFPFSVHRGELQQHSEDVVSPPI